ncbi:hypothetical protein Tco_1101828 [Tanacetum coccineum]
MENVNSSSPLRSPTSPFSRRVQKLDNILEPLGKIVPPPSSEPSYLEGELEFELVVGDEEVKELEEEVEEEFEEEEEEDDLEYFNTFPTREELEYHEWLLKNPRTSWVNARVRTGNLNNIKISCMIGHFLKRQAYIDLESPINVMSRLNYYWITSEGLESRRKPSNPKKICNFVGRVRRLKVLWVISLMSAILSSWKIPLVS